MNLYTGNPPVIIAGENTYTLTDFAEPEYDWDQHEYLLHTSKLTGKRILVSKGQYASFKILLRGLTKTAYEGLRGLKTGSAVTFYPYGIANITIDGGVYTAPSVSVIVTQAKRFHLNQTLWRDAMLIEMISQDYAEMELELSGA